MTLVEREEELALLRTRFNQCRAGSGQVVVVTGAVATGKTSLLYTVADEVTAAGALFLSAAGSTAERSLPLGVIRQLFESTNTAPEEFERLASERSYHALPHRVWPASPSEPPESHGVEQPLAEVLHSLSVNLLELAQECPVMIGVDDVHYADTLSLRCLLYLVRRMRSARMLLVLNEVASPHPANPVFRAELMRQPHFCHVQLGVLSLDAVTAIFASQVDADQAERLAAACYAVSGGNPLLVRAISVEHRIDSATRSGPTAQLAFGDAFDQAVVGYLYRSDPEQLGVARALAILGQPVSATVLGRLAGLDQAATERVIGALNAGGLLDSGRFRHPRVRAAVRDSITAVQRSELHRAAACLLHEDGASATVVAGHLLAADQFDFPWAARVLSAAAEQALAGGVVDFAIDCLKRAIQCSSDDHERAEAKALLVRAEWRKDPSTADMHLAELGEAIRRGELTGRTGLMSVRYLVWRGRIDEATEAMNRLAESVDDPETAADHAFTELWMGAFQPARRRRDGPEAAVVADECVAVAANAQTQAAEVLAAVVLRGADDGAVTSAEQVLQRTALDDWTLTPIGVAISALIHADQFDKATEWCDRLLAQAADRQAATWLAVLSALRAEAALCTGDLAAGEAHGRAALEYMSPQNWGTAVGLPLSATLQATTAAGKFDDAGRVLDHPLPDSMFHTSFGLLYLRARGRYYLATNRLLAALNDFRACGSLMKRWGLDLPGVVPWRADAAQAYLDMGKPRKARELIEEHLGRLGDGRSRSRAIALRILASTGELEAKQALLVESVDILQSCGDQLELARALADLGRVERGLGEPHRARTTVRRAWQMAKECRAETLSRALLPSLRAVDTRTEQPIAPAEPDGDALGLSDAERRVAALVVRGHSNREIARKLFITVSTVEQHLTRTYRKLNVARRSDLASKLTAEFAAFPDDLPVDSATVSRQPDKHDDTDDAPVASRN
jgi:DNA-binding CsgD family transcriptional regulator